MRGAATAALLVHSLRSGRAAQEVRQGACGQKMLGAPVYPEAVDLEGTLSLIHGGEGREHSIGDEIDWKS